MANLKLKTLFLAAHSCVLLLFILASQPFFAHGAPEGQGTVSNIKTEAEIRTILEKWRDRVKPTLDPKWVAEIEKNAKAMPIDTQEGVFSISYDDSETNKNIIVTPKANRRDWSYALDGFLFTFLGGNYANQGNKLDLGFWCFLEASLIHMLPDHLASVAFHLNERGEYDDAISILTYAKSLNPYHHSVCNNLAYSYSAKGNHKAAYDEMSRALSLKPESERYKSKLKFYADKSGIYTPAPQQKTPQAHEPSKAYMEIMPAVMGAINAYYREFMWTRWNDVFNRCFSSSHSSAKSVDYETVNRCAELHEQCCKNCYPASGIIPKGITKCLCACNIQNSQGKYVSGLQYFNFIRPIFMKWEKESIDSLELMIEEVASLVIKNLKSLRRIEIEQFETLITDTHLNHSEAIWNFHKTYIDETIMDLDDRRRALEETSLDCGKQLSADSRPRPEEFYGKRPPKLKRVPDGGKIWTIWFFFGDLKLYPDDNAKLTLGVKGIVAGKVSYNFRTGDKGAGVELGLNLGKRLGPFGEKFIENTMKFEFEAFVDTKEGLKYGLETGIRPKVGITDMNTDDLVIKLEN